MSLKYSKFTKFSAGNGGDIINPPSPYAVAYGGDAIGVFNTLNPNSDIYVSNTIISLFVNNIFIFIYLYLRI